MVHHVKGCKCLLSNLRERRTLLISCCLLLFLSQIWLETITQLHDRFEIQPYIRQREESLVDNHGQSVLIRLKQDLVRTTMKKRKIFFNNDLLQLSTLHFFESRLDNDTSVTMTWNRGSMVKPHFHASHLRAFISHTQASLSHYSPKSLLHRPLYLISVVHDAPPSRQFWYRIMVSRLNDASKASSSLLFSWGGSGEVTPAKSLMRAKSSSTAYDTGKRKHLSSNSHCLIALRKHKFAAHSSFPALPANQKGGLLILSTANV